MGTHLYAVTDFAGYYFPTDAAYRTWLNTIINNLIAWGLVQTADTGQVNTATVVRPGTGQYAIFRFNDALQATAPVFIKIDFTLYNASDPNQKRLQFTVGTGSNGAGVLTGVSPEGVNGYPIMFSTFAGLGGVNHWEAFSAANNRLVYALTISSGTDANANIFSIERTKDAAGADTGDGVLIVNRQAVGATHKHRVYYFAGLQPTLEAAPAIFAAASIVNGISGNNTALYAFNHYGLGGVIVQQGLNVLGYYNADLAALNAVQITIYGVLRTYLPLGGLFNLMRGAIPASGRVAIRWE